jgi:hypothetical protein
MRASLPSIKQIYLLSNTTSSGEGSANQLVAYAKLQRGFAALSVLTARFRP